ncbi:2-amino-4-hydroxy-6-hydroxymethyldihydropteridine diphosphokinase [Campylobacter showae]|jgi:2-amino-4-hydroxy-6-hydroxymethyldihydropteridine diphosphokinase|uniref:2-amino-4-hydroxy-6-hydroxymethyldihydropteridine pyrophosphokinase n=1 Tax=Campylobacter showae CSUNSWCD TaxID=1244083 RepID=M5IQ59_9BACT|nr:2-amino-4-hydroxy-6-hydroxymethyldihydropteridine diphosphokinase [Campylobacter showae]EKU10368.1 2-amino-4-hydroxy-6-hydroxymethyldihydropteridine pyrophosphokinase [Campylobacter showae CSUNSWCD]
MRVAGARRFGKCLFFPKVFDFRPGFKNSVILGLGGNIGDVKKRFNGLYFKLSRDSRFHIVENSALLINEAFGFKEQADFTNAVMLVQTSLAARQILKITANLEKRFGRVRSFKNAPRTLDIDILYFSGRSRNDARLTLPHPGAQSRASVILPLGTMKRVSKSGVRF